VKYTATKVLIVLLVIVINYLILKGGRVGLS